MSRSYFPHTASADNRQRGRGAPARGAVYSLPMKLRFLFAVVALFAFEPGAYSAGLGLQGPPGTLKGAAPPSEAERRIQKIVRDLRKGMDELKSDPLLVGFARDHATKAARGELDASAVPGLIERQKLAPFGYMFRFIAGKNAKELGRLIRRDKALTKAIRGDFTKYGVGIFEVPNDDPFLQMMILLAKERDPNAGQPGLSRTQTEPEIRRAAEKLRKECYEELLADNPNLRGDILAEMVIGADGSVTSTTLRKKLGDPRFDLCATNALNQLRFPKPYKGVPVTLRNPFRFAPAHGDQVIGVLEQSQVRATFARKAAELRQCQSARRKELAGKKLRGTILLDVVVAPDGSLKKVDVKTDSVGDSKLQACALEHIRSLQFPAPKYGADATFEFPLSFR